MVMRILSFLAFVACAYGYNWGPDFSACDTLMPQMPAMSMKIMDPMYYRIGAPKSTFYPGEQLHIRIKGKTSDDRYTYQGAMMTVKYNNMPVGMWGEFHKSKYTRVNCKNMMYSGIKEADQRYGKIVGDDVFIWMAPSTCDYSGTYTLHGTVIKNNNAYIQLSTSLKCVPMQPMPEPTFTDACKANVSVIPVPGTSFENNYGGWWNDPMAPMRWTRHRGPTKSPNTGPAKAIDGEWYIYTEASSPAKRGEYAILNSPKGLGGCFCIRTKCHMLTAPGVKLDFIVDGKIAFSHTQSADKWVDAWLTINEPREVKIQLKVTRGLDFRGDFAIDDIKITHGACPEGSMDMFYPYPENGPSPNPEYTPSTPTPEYMNNMMQGMNSMNGIKPYPESSMNSMMGNNMMGNNKNGKRNPTPRPERTPYNG